MAGTVYRDTSFMELLHPHLNKPDTKFNVDGLFKVKGIASGKPAEDLKAIIDRDCDKLVAEYWEDEKRGGKLSPAERKKITIYKPYADEEDDDGNPTGRTLFEFKQNAKIKLRDGTVKPVTIGLWDASGTKKVTAAIWSGSIGRLRYSIRFIEMKSTKQIGVRLDFASVQIKKLRSGSGSEQGFGSIEQDGDDEDLYFAPEGGEPASNETTSGGGDGDY